MGWTMRERDNGATYWLTPFDWKVRFDAQKCVLALLPIDL